MTVLQTAPFGHSGTASLSTPDGTRTRNLLAENQTIYTIDLPGQGYCDGVTERI